MLSIVLTDRCYDLVKKYIDYIQSQDNLVKSFDDRILDLLAAQIRLSEFRPVLGYIKRYVSDLHYTSTHIHLFLRDITENYLYAYCFIHGYPNFNNGIYHLIESAMTQLTIDELKKELEERKQKIINNQLQLVSRLK